MYFLSDLYNILSDVQSYTIFYNFLSDYNLLCILNKIHNIIKNLCYKGELFLKIKIFLLKHLR